MGWYSKKNQDRLKEEFFINSVGGPVDPDTGAPLVPVGRIHRWHKTQKDIEKQEEDDKAKGVAWSFWCQDQ